MKMFFHKDHEFIAVYGEITTQQENKEVMEHPVIKPIQQKRFQHTVIRQAIDINIKAGAEA